jgi:hypothetical protein
MQQTDIKMSYNSSRRYLTIPEYGRHVQQMIDHCVEIKDRDERTKAAKHTLRIMRQSFPHQKDMDKLDEKLWVHLHIMAQFKLDIDGEFETPQPKQLLERPDPMPYNQMDVKYGNYGRIIPKFIDVAMGIEDPEIKEAVTLNLVNLMKLTFMTWTDDTINDEVILEQLKIMSNGKLSLKDESQISSNKELSPLKPVRQGNFKRNSNNNKNNKNFKGKNTKKWGRSK